MNVCLILIATGKYHAFVPDLIRSAKQFFLKNHRVRFHLFTDSPNFDESDDLSVTYVPHSPWPGPTLMRYNIILHERSHLSKYDYLFYIDVDMRFVSEIGDEVLSSLTLVRHFGFIGGGAERALESNPKSTAHVSYNTAIRHSYVAGGFLGGSAKEFIKLAETISGAVLSDLNKRIVAKWHDESHLNKYASITAPTKLLDSSYCWPENIKHCQFGPIKIVALLKNHSEIRS